MEEFPVLLLTKVHPVQVVLQGLFYVDKNLPGKINRFM
jgi:hypothetical protein